MIDRGDRKVTITTGSIAIDGLDAPVDEVIRWAIKRLENALQVHLQGDETIREPLTIKAPKKYFQLRL